MADGSEQAHDGADRAARAIYTACADFQFLFNAITRQAQNRFEARDWHGLRDDSTERLALYSKVMTATTGRLQDLLGPRSSDPEIWKALKRSYRRVTAGKPNPELAETFFNSVTRRVFSTVGVNPEIEFLAIDAEDEETTPGSPIYTRLESSGDTARLMLAILYEFPFDMGYADPEEDGRLAARRVDEHVAREAPGERIDAVEVVHSPWFRGKTAYIVGRLRCGERILPLVLPLHYTERGVAVDAVVMNENEVSILFSFARSYFHVEAEWPRALIGFLRSIMPLKPVAELWTSIGFNKHGKTLLFRDLQRHLTRSDGRFDIAEGDRGMVMIVFTLPGFDVVFKIIRDSFAHPKRTTRALVMERYRLVFKRDRVGRLVDAQQFEHLTFDRSRFSDALIEELTEEASQSVSVVGHRVAVRHLYTERKMTPLNLYLRQADDDAATRAVADYGNAIKELAAANIFPGDFLLKNFGVTRHGRIVFYDYDELCLVTDCNFRCMPPARDDEQELAAEPWFTVEENDIFPEEFEKFLGIQPPLRERFVRDHGDLFTVEFWRGLQERHLRGEIMDFFPYPEQRRLRHYGHG